MSNTTSPPINRRQALAAMAAGAAVALTGRIGTAAAAVLRPKRYTGAFYVREYDKIGVYPWCAIDSDGKKKIWHRLGT